MSEECNHSLCSTLLIESSATSYPASVTSATASTLSDRPYTYHNSLYESAIPHQGKTPGNAIKTHAAHDICIKYRYMKDTPGSYALAGLIRYYHNPASPAGGIRVTPSENASAAQINQCLAIAG